MVILGFADHGDTVVLRNVDYGLETGVTSVMAVRARMVLIEDVASAENLVAVATGTEGNFAIIKMDEVEAAETNLLVELAEDFCDDLGPAEIVAGSEEMLSIEAEAEVTAETGLNLAVEPRKAIYLVEELVGLGRIVLYQK
jgi:hypothetical protein